MKVGAFRFRPDTGFNPTARKRHAYLTAGPLNIEHDVYLVGATSAGDTKPNAAPIRMHVKERLQLPKRSRGGDYSRAQRRATGQGQARNKETPSVHPSTSPHMVPKQKAPE